MSRIKSFLKKYGGALILGGYLSYCGIGILEHPIKFLIIMTTYVIGNDLHWKEFYKENPYINIDIDTLKKGRRTNEQG